MKKILMILAVTCFVAVGCKKSSEKENTPVKKEVAVVNTKEASFKILGMTCEVGCAKMIASKLSKKEGVLASSVVFKDSVANVKFDASKTTTKELRAYVESLGKDNMYKTCDLECKKTKKECNKTEVKEDAKAKCDKKVSKTACSKKDAKVKCDKKAAKTACSKKDCSKMKNCTELCCKDVKCEKNVTKEAKECSKVCCVNNTTKNECKNACCA